MTLVSMRDLEFKLGHERSSLQNLAGKAPRFYDPFDVVKRSGTGCRHIDNPTGVLKEVQRRIYKALLRDLALPTNMIGGVAGRSVRENALAHVGHETMIKLDLRNHFGRITNGQVFKALRRELGASVEIARLLTQLTTVHARVPQGASTSSMIANLVILPAHREIAELAERHGVNYTLFVDDLTLSGGDTRAILQDVIHILQKHGFAVTARKLKILGKHERQETTGLVVNHHLTIARAEREEIRKAVVRHSQAKRISTQQFASLWGRIRYVAFIDPSHGNSLAELAETRLPRPEEEDGTLPDERRLPCQGSARHRHRPATPRSTSEIYVS